MDVAHVLQRQLRKDSWTQRGKPIMRAAFVGADPRIADLATLAIHLRWPEVTPIVVTSAAEALAMISRESLNVVLLHPDLGDRTLAQLIRDIRELTHVPLLVLADQGDETEVVTALEAGADDYVRLPRDLTEIMTRIWALIRRAELQTPIQASSDEAEGLLRSGPLSLNPTTYEVSLADDRIPLTATEFRLLHFLMKNRGAVVAHQTMGGALWRGRMGSDKIAKKYVQRLRGKLDDDPREPHWIASVHGIGYRFIGPHS